MEIQVERVKEHPVTLVKIPPRLEGTISKDLRILLKELVEKGEYWIVVDLSETVYMDSSGLGAIVSRLATSRMKGGDVRLSGLNTFLQDLIRITNLDRVIRIYPDPQAAIESFYADRLLPQGQAKNRKTAVNHGSESQNKKANRAKK